MTELIKLRAYLEHLIVHTGGSTSKGDPNVTGWFRRHGFEVDGLMSRATFGAIFSKSSTPDLETFIKLGAIVNRARASIGQPPVTPKSIAMLVPSYAALFEALEAGSGTIDKRDRLSDEEAQGQLVVQTMEALPLAEQMRIVPKMLQISADAIALAKLDAPGKLAWLFSEMNRRRSKGWQNFWQYYFPAKDLPFDVMLALADKQRPTKPLNKKQIQSIEGFILEVQDRTPITFKHEDLDFLRKPVGKP